MKTISVFYGHVAGNIGDIAINEGEHRLLRAAFPDAHLQFVTLRSAKSQFVEFSMPSMELDDNTSVVHFMPQSINAPGYVATPASFLAACGAEDTELVILAAGEHVFSYADNDNSFNLFWRTLPLYVAKRLNIKTATMPATYGPFETERAAELAKYIASMADFFAVRDKESAEVIASITGHQVKVFPDPAFWLEPYQSRRHKGHYVFAMRSEGWGIRLSKQLRDDSSAHFGATQYKDSLAFQYSLAVASAILSADGTRITLAVQTLADADLANSLLNTLLEQYPGQLSIYRPESIEAYLVLLGSADCVFTSRFHAVIMAQVAGTPAIASYFPAHGHKMPGLLSLLNKHQYCQEITADNLQQAIDNSIALLNDDDQILPSVPSGLALLQVELQGQLRNSKAVKASPGSLLNMAEILTQLADGLMQEGVAAAQAKVSSQYAKRFKAQKADVGRLEKQLAETKALLSNQQNQARLEKQQLQQQKIELSEQITALKKKLEKMTEKQVGLSEQSLFFREMYEELKSDNLRLKRLLGIKLC